MITLLAAVLSFLTSSLPHVLNYYKDKQDKSHELALMDRQILLQEKQSDNQLQEIQIQAQSAEMQSIHIADKPTGTWVDALDKSVRPVLAYLIVLQYILTKIYLYSQLLLENEDLNFLIETFHDNEDMALVSSVIGLYFGNRYFKQKFG